MDRRRGSKCDIAARRRLTIKRADNTQLYDATPARIENKYPLLHARSRDLDDLLLQEIYLLMFRDCEVAVTPYSEWVSVPQLVSLFHVSVLPSSSSSSNDAGTPIPSPEPQSLAPLARGGGRNARAAQHGPSLVGGMLFACGEFLFGEMPFVRNRVKDVRCRLEFDSMEGGGLAWLGAVPQPPRVSSPSTHQRGESIQLMSMDMPEAGDNGVSASLGDKDDATGGLHHLSSSTAVAESDDRSSSSPHRNSAAGPSPPVQPKMTAGGVRLPPNVNLSSNGIATCRVHFRVEEFECGAMSWVVQRFQLVEPNHNVAYGPVFARAFQPFDAVSGAPLRVRRVPGAPPQAVPGGSDGPLHQDEGDNYASTQFGVGIEIEEMRRAKRKALPGEERLRVLKPALYQWCLDRVPTEMGAAATMIKELLLYFRHTFSVVRTIRMLMRAVRRIQIACRRMIERRRNATVRMLTEWTVLELDVQTQLKAYVPVATDPVDAAVYEALKANIITSDEFKLGVMAETYAMRQQERLLLPPDKRGDTLLAARYRFYIAPQDLLAESHRRLVERLCRTADSPIFKDVRIREILRDRTDEILRARAKKEREEQQRRHAARNKGTFGTSERSARWEHPSVAGRHETRRKTSPRRGNATTDLTKSGSSSLLYGGGVLPPVPPAAGRSPNKRVSSSFRGSPLSPPMSPVRRQHRNQKGKGRQPRPQHLDVIDEMFDDA